MTGGADRHVFERRRRRDGCAQDARGNLLHSPRPGCATDEEHPSSLQSLRPQRVHPISEAAQHSLDGGTGEVPRRGVGAGKSTKSSRGVGEVRGTFTVEVGQEDEPTGARLGADRQPVQPIQVGPEHGGGGSEDPGRVEGAARGRKRPVASANPATTPVASVVGAVCTPKTVPLVPSDTTTSPGSSPSPSAAPMLSPVPAATSIPPAVCPAASDRKS